MPRWKPKKSSFEVVSVGGALRQRTCIGCRDSRDKQEMLRLFRTDDGGVGVDPKGNMPGRGAYICSSECLETALRRNLIGRSLRVKFANVFEDSERSAIDAFFSNKAMKSCKE